MAKKQIAAWFLMIALLLGALTACAGAGGGTVSPISAAQTPEAAGPGENSTVESFFEDTAVEESGLEEALPAVEKAEKTPLPAPDPDRLMETIGVLCKTSRPIGSEREKEIAQYLQSRLEEYGYTSYMETFPYNISSTTLSQRYQQARSLTGDAFFKAALPGEYKDGDSQNVIGAQPWEAEKEKVLVLSAHYDSTPDSIGVIDNATGVAVVLEAARILAAEELPFSVRIVFFGGEEAILIGSRQHLLGMEPGELERIAGNITVDTLAYKAQEDFVVLTSLALPQETPEALAQASPVAAALLKDSRVTPAFRSSLVGDHVAFANAGIDSVNFGQSMDDVFYVINSPQDTYAYLVPEILPNATTLLVDTVLELAAQMPAAGQTP